MEAPPARVVSARTERRAIAALFAVFALLVQALIPNIAIAAAGPNGSSVICTLQGAQEAPADGGAPAQPSPSHPCQHCICCPPTAALPPSTVTMASVSYAYAEVPPPAAPERLIPPARAPPRPPGQGPPTPNA